MRATGSIVGVMLLSGLFARAAWAAAGGLLGIKPDPRAVESGLYIQPVKPASRAVVTFTVTEPSGVARKRCPVRGAVPLYRGELKDPRKIRLIEAGREIPVQGMATALWPEGTLKFLCLDFLVDLAPGQTKQFKLEYGSSVSLKARSSIKATEGGSVSIDTGKMKVSFAPGSQFCSKISVDGKAVTRGPVTGQLLVSEGSPTGEPTSYRLIIKKVELVESGPVQATVYLKGSYGTKKSVTKLSHQIKKNVARYVFHGFVRMYGGSARMDLIHSFGYNGDENRDFVRRYGLLVPLDAAGGSFVYGGDDGVKKEAVLTGDLQLVQPRHNSWELKGPVADKGKRFGGWAGVKGKAVIGLRDAWQQWPVSFTANEKGDLAIDIYGGAEDTFLDLRYMGPGFQAKTGTNGFHKSKSMYSGEKFSIHYTSGNATQNAAGLLKISDLVLDFTPDADDASIGNGHHDLLVPWPGAKRFSDTRVFGLTGYYHDTGDPRLKKVKTYFDILIDFPYVVHNANEMFGWVDWPDAPDFGRPKGGRFDVSRFGGGVGWTNGERTVMGYIAQYIASGSRRVLKSSHMCVLHTIGFDIEHDGGDGNTGECHRHNQVHWASGGGPRQAGWRGWYMHYWLFGYNETLRSLKELHYVPYTIHPNSNAARWPWHPTWGPNSLVVKETEKRVWVQGSDGTPFHWMNLTRYMTTGESNYVRHTDRIMEFWKRNPTGGKKGVPAGFYVDTATGKVLPGFEKNFKFLGYKPDDPPSPRYATYYWGTYGGASLVAEWAQLTGSTHAVDLILAFGDWHVSDKRGDRRFDIRHSPKGSKFDQLYRSYEGFVPSYVLLRKKSHPEWAQRWIDGMKWRLFDYPYGSPRNLARGARQLEPDEYTAEKYRGTGVKTYGQNGHKIAAGQIMPAIYTLWFLRPEGTELPAGPQPEKPGLDGMAPRGGADPAAREPGVSRSAKEKKAGRLYQMARRAERMGQANVASSLYKKILEKFPGTKVAAKARKKLK